MSRYRGPKLRLVRRLGSLVSLTSKTSKRLGLPGQQSSVNRKFSQFYIRLREKQKVRYFYSINERQLLNYLKLAKRKKTSSGRELLILLEMRLDVILFRLSLFQTILAARQFILHKNVLVNGKLVNIPSYNCKVNDIIAFNSSDNFLNTLKSNFKNHKFPSYFDVDLINFLFKIINKIDLDNFSPLFNDLLIVEYYSFIL